MEKITTIGLDLAKSIFQVHAVADDGCVVVRRVLATIAGTGLLQRTRALPCWARRPVPLALLGERYRCNSGIRSG